MSLDAAAASLHAVAARFATGAAVATVEPFSGPAGHINASYIVSGRAPRDRPIRFFLQRLNAHVFPSLAELMENVKRVTQHVGGPLRLVPTRGGDACLQDEHGDVWRLYDFIEGAVTRPIATAADAEHAARAFGAFQRALGDLPGPRLHETIPHFHDTPRRLESFECAVQRDAAGRAAGARAEVAEIRAHRDLAAVLVQAAAAGAVPERVVHNDAKLANVLFDAAGAVRCVIDLDTVMPGALLHDFGDMVRSMTTPTDEDESDLASVGVQLPLFEAVAGGFAEGAGAILSPRERALLVHAGLLVTLEQAARFLTDDLEGDVYYRVSRKRHNLARARTQLKQLETLKARRDELEAIVARLTPSSPTSSAPA